MTRFSPCLLLGCLVTVVSGCSQAGLPEYASVSGSVTYRQKPVEGATVILSPDNLKGYSATGTTDSEGNFALSTYFDPQNTFPGVVLGTYQVIIIKKEIQPIPEELTGYELMDYLGKLPPPKSLIPEKYAISGKSGLTLQVDGRDIENMRFDLED